MMTLKETDFPASIETHMDKSHISPQTRNNWLIVTVLTLSGLPLIVSGLYFLFLPQGGYQGGRNAAYGLVILFNRNTWDLLHTWAGVVLIATAALHIPLHWSWITTMTKRIFKIMFGQCERMNVHGQFNLLVDGLIGLSGLIAAASGMVFLFFPSIHGEQTLPDVLLFDRSTWDVIHTWSGVTMIAAGILHFSIHWRWICKVTAKLLFFSPAHMTTAPGPSLR